METKVCSKCKLIDHIIHHADFEYINEKDESFIECWAIKNLRPLSAKENNKDGVSRILHKKKEK